MPDKMEMSLATRTAKFAVLLERYEITGRDGNAFELEPGVMAATRMLSQVHDSRSSVYVIGNGGSAAIASHAANDLVNVVKLRASIPRTMDGASLT